jgi:hypothetical protein
MTTKLQPLAAIASKGEQLLCPLGQRPPKKAGEFRIEKKY